jgi:hypothetical protein
MYITGFKAILVRKLLISITTITLQPGALRAGGRGGGGVISHNFFSKWFLKSQFPQKNANFSFTLAIEKDKLMNL